MSRLTKGYMRLRAPQADKNRWKFCNYNDNGIGFPRDCGKNGAVGGQWNSLKRGGHKVTWTKGADRYQRYMRMITV